MEDLDEAKRDGANAARSAIAAGVPRRLVVVTQGVGARPSDPIDAATGLPIATVSVPPNLALRQNAFASAFNAEISRALMNGEIAVDFRPFLAPAADIVASLKGRHAVLEPKHPILIAQARVRYEVFVPRPPKVPPRFKPPSSPCVRRKDERGTHWITKYEGSPIPFAIRADEATIAFNLGQVIAVYHVVSGQLLQWIHSN
jgi:hypothetical protein